MSRSFSPKAAFQPPETGYRLLPFRFHRVGKEQEILVNECGEFALAPRGTAEKLVRKRLSTDEELYTTLKAKHFIYDDYSSALLDVLASKYRTKFGFIYEKSESLATIRTKSQD